VKEMQDNGVAYSKMGEGTNVYDEERSGRSSVVSDDLCQGVEQTIRERPRFRISKNFTH
jgi:hypothetical protein